MIFIHKTLDLTVVTGIHNFADFTMRNFRGNTCLFPEDCTFFFKDVDDKRLFDSKYSGKYTHEILCDFDFIGFL